MRRRHELVVHCVSWRVALALGIAVLVASLGEEVVSRRSSPSTSSSPGWRRSGRRPPNRLGPRRASADAAGIVAIVVAVEVLGRQLVVEAGPDWIIDRPRHRLDRNRRHAAGGWVRREGPGAASARTRRRLPATEIALGLAELLLGGAFLTADLDWIWPAVAVWGIVGGTALLRDAQRRRRLVARTQRG